MGGGGGRRISGHRPAVYITDEIRPHTVVKQGRLGLDLLGSDSAHPRCRRWSPACLISEPLLFHRLSPTKHGLVLTLTIPTDLWHNSMEALA